MKSSERSMNDETKAEPEEHALALVQKYGAEASQVFEDSKLTLHRLISRYTGEKTESIKLSADNAAKLFNLINTMQGFEDHLISLCEMQQTALRQLRKEHDELKNRKRLWRPGRK